MNPKLLRSAQLIRHLQKQHRKRIFNETINWFNEVNKQLQGTYND
jgi:hypothetical protein